VTLNVRTDVGREKKAGRNYSCHASLISLGCNVDCCRIASARVVVLEDPRPVAFSVPSAASYAATFRQSMPIK
jgi:hypothetical protein